jgi:cell division protein FtsZ
MRLKEQMAISEHVARKIQTEARMFKFGAITDKTLGDSLRVTIIAAGFDGTTTLMDQLKGTAEPEVIVDSTPALELSPNTLEQQVPSNILMPDETDGDEADTVRVNVTDKVQEEEMTMTGPGGITINRPDSTPSLGLRPESADDSDTLIMDEERPGDADLIRRMVDAFVKGGHVPAELDRPTFERNKTLLYNLPMLPEHEFVRSKLND